MHPDSPQTDVTRDPILDGRDSLRLVKLRLALTLITVAILPIGGHYTMGPREAALAVRLLGVHEVIPVHYGTFPILAGTPAQLEAALVELGLTDVNVHALERGVPLER